MSEPEKIITEPETRFRFPALYINEREKIITELETRFPALSGVAFATARKETLAAGQSVLQSENGVIYEVSPDGTRIERKQIEPPISIPVGTRISIG